MPQDKTFAEAITDTANELCAALDQSNDPKAIDWSNVKKLLAQLLVQFGPAILTLLVANLDPTDTA